MTSKATLLTSLTVLLLLASATSTACKSGTGRADGDWKTDRQEDEGGSTHLWLMNRALDIVAARSEGNPAAARIRDLMQSETCREQWQRGLYDADHKLAYNDNLTFESHFYNPETGNNWRGRSAPSGLTETIHHTRAMLVALDPQHRAETDGCYEAGLALHFFTDATQPMHVASFTALEKPIGLHANYEAYALRRQDEFGLADFKNRMPRWRSIDEAYVANATETAAKFKSSWNTISTAYGEASAAGNNKCASLNIPASDFWNAQIVDRPECWQTSAEVGEMTRELLEDAQEHTAAFLIFLGGQLSDPE
jgi:hypothetical protein